MEHSDSMNAISTWIAIRNCKDSLVKIEADHQSTHDSTTTLCEYIRKHKDQISIVFFSFPNTFTSSTHDITKISKECGSEVHLIIDITQSIGCLELNLS